MLLVFCYSNKIIYNVKKDTKTTLIKVLNFLRTILMKGSHGETLSSTHCTDGISESQLYSYFQSLKEENNIYNNNKQQVRRISCILSTTEDCHGGVEVALACSLPSY